MENYNNLTISLGRLNDSISENNTKAVLSGMDASLYSNLFVSCMEHDKFMERFILLSDVVRNELKDFLKKYQ